MKFETYLIAAVCVALVVLLTAAKTPGANADQRCSPAFDFCPTCPEPFGVMLDPAPADGCVECKNGFCRKGDDGRLTVDHSPSSTVYRHERSIVVKRTRVAANECRGPVRRLLGRIFRRL